MGFVVVNSVGLRRDFRTLLRDGLIPLGDVRIPIESMKFEIFDSLTDRQVQQLREWKAEDSSWARYTFATDILWYPIQPVLFTFRDDVLVLIEFHGSTNSDPDSDYSLEVEQYFQAKKEIVKHLDKESRCLEADASSMETVWDFANLSLYLACDARSGGCGIAVRPLGGK